jgi:hypothetical protein
VGIALNKGKYSSATFAELEAEYRSRLMSKRKQTKVCMQCTCACECLRKYVDAFCPTKVVAVFCGGGADENESTTHAGDNEPEAGAIVVDKNTNDDDKDFWLGEALKFGSVNASSANFVQVADEAFTDDETEFGIGDEFCKIR